MDFKTSKPGSIKVTVDGQEYSLAKPTMGQQIELEKAIKACEADKSSLLEPMVKWVSALGLPEAVAMSFDQESFMDLVAYISGSKKN